MPNLAVNDVYRINIYVVTATQMSKNTLFFKVTTFTAGATDTNLVRALEGVISGPMKALITTDSSYRGCGAQRVQPQPTTMEVYSIVGQGVGTVASPPLPTQCCGLITKRTAFAGPKYRGRLYAPFPGEADSAGATGLPTAGYITRLDALALQTTGFQSEVDGGISISGDYGLFNQSSGVFTPTLTWTSRPRWATQRRRGSYGPENVSPI